jgi:hypothetical protein
MAETVRPQAAGQRPVLGLTGGVYENTYEMRKREGRGEMVGMGEVVVLGRKERSESQPPLLPTPIHFLYAHSRRTMADAIEPPTEETTMREEDDVQENDAMDAVSSVSLPRVFLVCSSAG